MDSDGQANDRKVGRRLRARTHLSMYRSMLIGSGIVAFGAVYAAVSGDYGVAIFTGLLSPSILIGSRIYRREAMKRRAWPEGHRYL